jgi:hypothetical protein
MGKRFPDVVDRLEKRAQYEFKYIDYGNHPWGVCEGARTNDGYVCYTTKQIFVEMVERTHKGNISSTPAIVPTERQARGWNRHQNTRGSDSKKYKYTDPRLEAYMASR